MVGRERSGEDIAVEPTTSSFCAAWPSKMQITRGTLETLLIAGLWGCALAAEVQKQAHGTEHKALFPLDEYDKWGFSLIALMTAIAAGKSCRAALNHSCHSFELCTLSRVCHTVGRLLARLRGVVHGAARAPATVWAKLSTRAVSSTLWHCVLIKTFDRQAVVSGEVAS